MMKTRKRIPAVLVLLSSVLLRAAAGNFPGEPLVGTWQFYVPEAPWEYSKGKLIFEVGSEEKVAGNILFDTGKEVAIDELFFEEEQVSFEAVVDGYRVKTVFVLEEDHRLTGTVETAEGTMNVSAERMTAGEE